MANVKGGILKKSLIEGDLTYEIWRKAYHKKSCSVSEAAFFKKKDYNLLLNKFPCTGNSIVFYKSKEINSALQFSHIYA